MMTKETWSTLLRKELKEKKENTMTLKGKVLVMIGDKVPLTLTILEDPPYGGACGCHPLDPLPPDPMDLLGNLVDALHDAGLQANPGHRHKFQQALRRCAQGGILPDPNFNPRPRLRQWWHTPSEDSSSHFQRTPRRKAWCSHLCCRRLDGSHVLQRRSVHW